MPYTNDDLDAIAFAPTGYLDFSFPAPPRVSPDALLAGATVAGPGPTYEQQRSENLQAVDATAQQAAAAGKDYLPFVGWYDPQGTSFTDRLGQIARFGMRSAQSVLPGGTTALALDALRQGGLNVPNPTRDIEREIFDPAAQRIHGGVSSALGAVTEPAARMLGFQDPVAAHGADVLAANRALEGQKRARDAQTFGETGAYWTGLGRGAAQSAAQATLALVPGVGQAGLIATQAVQSGGEAVDDAKRSGFSDQGALAYGATMGAIEGLITKFVGDRFGHGAEAWGVKTTVKAGLANLFKEIGKNVAAEQLEENLITGFQGVVRALNGLDPAVPEGLNSRNAGKWAAESLVPQIRDTVLQTLMVSGPTAPLQARQAQIDTAQRTADEQTKRDRLFNANLIEAQEKQAQENAVQRAKDLQTQAGRFVDDVEQAFGEQGLQDLVAAGPSRKGFSQYLRKTFGPGNPGRFDTDSQEARAAIVAEAARRTTDDESAGRDLRQDSVYRWARSLPSDQLGQFAMAADRIRAGGQDYVDSVRQKAEAGQITGPEAELARNPHWWELADAVRSVWQRNPAPKPVPPVTQDEYRVEPDRAADPTVERDTSPVPYGKRDDAFAKATGLVGGLVGPADQTTRPPDQSDNRSGAPDLTDDAANPTDEAISVERVGAATFVSGNGRHLVVAKQAGAWHVREPQPDGSDVGLATSESKDAAIAQAKSLLTRPESPVAPEATREQLAGMTDRTLRTLPQENVSQPTVERIEKTETNPPGEADDAGEPVEILEEVLTPEAHFRLHLGEMQAEVELIKDGALKGRWQVYDGQTHDEKGFQGDFVRDKSGNLKTYPTEAKARQVARRRLYEYVEQNTKPGKEDPTPEEIRARMAEVQQGWTPEQRDARRQTTLEDMLRDAKDSDRPTSGMPRSRPAPAKVGAKASKPFPPIPGVPESYADEALNRAPASMVAGLADLAQAVTGRRPTMATGFVTEKRGGQFEKHAEIAATAPGDFDTAVHEVAHHLMKHGFADDITRPENALAAREMIDAGNTLYADEDGEYNPLEEGFAELVRLTVTDPGAAAERFANGYLWLSDKLDAHPKFKAAFERQQEAAKAWKGKDPIDRSKERARDAREATRAADPDDRLRLMMRWANANASIDKLRDDMNLRRQADGLDKLTIEQDPAERAAFVSGRTGAKTNESLERLKQAWQPVLDAGKDAAETFDRYLVWQRQEAFLEHDEAMRAIAADESRPRSERRRALRQIRNWDGGERIADIRENIARSEKRYPFLKAAAEATWAELDRVNEYMKEMSETLKIRLERIEATDPGRYIPAHREQGRGYTESLEAEITKGLRSGSAQVVKDPMSTLPQEIASRYELAHRRFVQEAVIDLMTPGTPAATEGAGAWVRELFPETRDDVRRWRRDPNVIRFESGEGSRYFQFRPVLTETITNATVAEATKTAELLKKLTPGVRAITQVNKVAKAGYTLLNPAFTFFRNPLQTSVGFFFKSKEWNPVKQAVALGGSYLTLIGHGLGIAPSTDVKAFLEDSGLLGQNPNVSENSMQDRIARQAAAGESWAKRMGLKILDLGDSWRKFTGMLDLAGAFAEGRLTAKRLGVADISQATREQRMQIDNAMKAFMPYHERGTHLAVVDQFAMWASVPITNARGVLKIARSNPQLFAFRAGLAGLAAVAMALKRGEDDEKWKKEPDYVRLGGISFYGEDGEPVAYLPFNTLETQLFLGVPIAVMESLRTGSADPAKREAWEIFKQNLLLNQPALVEEVIRQGANRRELGGEAELAPRPAAVDNWTADTTGLARWIGEKSGIAPTRIDSALDNLTGGTIPGVWKTGERLAGERRPENLWPWQRKGDDATLAAQGARQRFYRLKDQWEQKPEAERAQETPREQRIRTVLGKYANVLADLSALARSAKTAEERHRYETQAAELADAVVTAIEESQMPRPIQGLGKRLDRERKLVGAR